MTTLDSSGGVGIAIVGCGYVADSYAQCLDLHGDRLRLVGAFDREPGRLASFQRVWGAKAYGDLDEVLADPAVALVVNLTTPDSHAEVTGRAIAAGRHVYSEKPLGLTTAEAGRLRDAAARKGVRLAAAPSNVLGEQAQTLWKAAREGRIGAVRLVYAELDDGLIHKAPYRDWISRSGKPWPAEHEFEVGCTFEHAGYVITLLVAMFGPVRRVTSTAGLLIPDKIARTASTPLAPDFSCGCLAFDGGVLARVTNSIVAPYDHRLRLFGEGGTLQVKEPWDFAAPVRLRRPAASRVGRMIERRLPPLPGTVVESVRPVPFRAGRGRPTMDFMRGVRELADAIVEDRPCRMSADLAVHVTEVTEMLQHPERFDQPTRVRSDVAPMAPMPWAV